MPARPSPTADVLVNNAASFQAGYFEEISAAQMCRQVETNLFGPVNVTRTVLPVMRAQRDGHVITITSLAGVTGLEFCVACAAAKFGLEGFTESLRYDVEPFGICTAIVEPAFRTEPLVDGSTRWAELSLHDYVERTSATRKAWEAMNGQQAGDPARLAAALLALASQEQTPARFVGGADASEAVTAKARDLLAQSEASRPLGGDLAHAAAA